MIFLVNKWGSTDMNCSTIFRTNNLEAWLKAIKEIKERYKLKESDCEWLKHTNGSGEITIFSFATEAGKRYWVNRSYTKRPDFVFTGFPEGIKYV